MHSNEVRSPFPRVAEVQQQAFSGISCCAKGRANNAGRLLLFALEKLIFISLLAALSLGEGAMFFRASTC